MVQSTIASIPVTFEEEVDTMGNKFSVVAFGSCDKYKLGCNYIANAARNTEMHIEHMSVFYDNYVDQLVYTPHGRIYCSHCNTWKNIGKRVPAFTVHEPYRGKTPEDKLVCKSLVCLKCCVSLRANTARSIRSLVMLGESPRLIKQQAKKQAIDKTVNKVVQVWKHKVRVKQSLKILRPYIMHWGAKPDGPLYKLAIARLHESNKAMYMIEGC
jgi:hypothetical protein